MTKLNQYAVKKYIKTLWINVYPPCRVRMKVYRCVHTAVCLRQAMHED